MKHETGYFESNDGLKLYYQAWFPEVQPKAVLQIFHGFAEHSGRYLNIVNALVPSNYALFIHDHRGHGKSEGITNYTKKFENFIEDGKIFSEMIRSRHPDLPIFLLGHSMGSGIAIHFAGKYENHIKGLILSGTGVSLGEEVSGFLKLILMVLGRLAPKLTIDPKLDPNSLSHDPEVVKAYIEDPLVNYDIVTMRLGYLMLKNFKKLPEIVQNLSLPTLVQRGSDDIAVQGFEELESSFKMQDKEIHIYEGLFHEVYNENKSERKKVLADLSNWLNNHLD